MFEAEMESSKFYIITGGPGTGKSALISTLASQGFAAMPEAGRAIIQDQLAIDGPALPWKDRLAFAELMLGWEMRSLREAAKMSGPVFFDRGVPDVAGYLRLCGLATPDHVMEAAKLFRYQRLVFFAPPWPEIYHRDEERKQSWKEAVSTGEAMMKIYTELGYEICALPLVSVEERCAFIIDRLNQKKC